MEKKGYEKERICKIASRNNSTYGKWSVEFPFHGYEEFYYIDENKKRVNKAILHEYVVTSDANANDQVRIIAKNDLGEIIELDGRRKKLYSQRTAALDAFLTRRLRYIVQRADIMVSRSVSKEDRFLTGNKSSIQKIMDVYVKELQEFLTFQELLVWIQKEKARHKKVEE